MVIQTKNHVQLERIDGLIILTGYHFNDEEQREIADFIEKYVDECEAKKMEEEDGRVPILRVPKNI